MGDFDNFFPVHGTCHKTEKRAFPFEVREEAKSKPTSELVLKDLNHTAVEASQVVLFSGYNHAGFKKKLSMSTYFYESEFWEYDPATGKTVYPSKTGNGNFLIERGRQYVKYDEW